MLFNRRLQAGLNTRSTIRLTLNLTRQVRHRSRQVINRRLVSLTRHSVRDRGYLPREVVNGCLQILLSRRGAVGRHFELFKSVTATDIVHIPFKGIAPATVSLIAGEVDVMMNTTPPALPQVRAGRLRAIAMASLKRTTVAPDVPTLVESGLPGFEAGVWYGMMGPAALPPEIVTRLHQELARIVRLPEVRERLAVEGVEPVGNTPAEFAAYLKMEMAKYAAIAQKARIRAE